MNFREVNEDDILKEWLEYREETAFCTLSPQDKKYCINFDEISENILKNVPNQNKKYVQKQLDILDKNFMDYLCYWNEKYYRNGFVDGSQIVMGCFEENYTKTLIFIKILAYKDKILKCKNCTLGFFIAL